MSSYCWCHGRRWEQSHHRHRHQLPLPFMTPTIAVAAINRRCRNGKDSHCCCPPLGCCPQQRRQRRHCHHHHQLPLPHDCHWLCPRATSNDNDIHPRPHLPSPHHPSEGDRTAGWRARRDASHSSSPRSLLLAPSSSPLAGQRCRGRWPRQQTRPSRQYPQPGRGGTSQPHLPLRMKTAIAGLALRGRRPARRDCCRTSPCPPRCPQFD